MELDVQNKVIFKTIVNPRQYLQKKVSFKTTFARRQEMIRRENLHIAEEISIEQFRKLYTKYGRGLDKTQFARCFLDIGHDANYDLQVGNTKKVRILSKEYVPYQEFLKVQQKVREIYVAKPGELVNYDKIMEMYDNVAGKLSLRMFVEEVLNITMHDFSCIGPNKKEKKRKMLKPISFDWQEVFEIQTKVAQESGRHMDEKITLAEFEELYHQFGRNFDKKIFATKVLQMLSYRLNTFFAGKCTTGIFIEYSMTPDAICKLREEVILNENLHIEEPISKEDFERLYQKYGGILSEEIFAEEILDISIESIRYMKKGGKAIILTDTEVPQEYLEAIRERIILENGFEQNHFLTIEQVKNLYERYGEKLSERQFIEGVLDAKEYAYEHYKKNLEEENLEKKISILNNQQTTDFEELRRRVIQKEHLHYADRISYAKLKKLHQKYAPNVKENLFAEKVLDISNDIFSKLKSPKVKNYKTTLILLNEKLPTDEEIEAIKATMIIKNNLHTKGKMQYPKFTEYYLKYGGVMPEDMFAKRTLDIGKAALYKMKKDDNKEIFILLHTSEDEIQSLKEKLEKEGQERITKLERRVENIIENCAYTEANVAIVKEYLDLVQKNFNPKNFDKGKLDFLEESIQFSQGGAKYIEFFSKVCVAFREYQKANRFIAQNMDNVDVKKEEIAKLKELQKSIIHAMKREKAIRMIYETGITDIPLIIKDTGLSEIEILQIRKMKMIENKKVENSAQKEDSKNKGEK